jgi:hypothetical protein
VRLTPEEWLQRLIRKHQPQIEDLQTLNDFYENEPPISYMHPELVRELDGRLQQLLLNWSQLAVDPVEERSDLTGFELAGGKAAEDLWGIWQANDLDEQSSQAHIDSMVFGRSFAIVGAGDEPDAPPLITVESPMEVHAELDPRTREVAAAYKTWREELGDRSKVEHATLYLPSGTSWWVKRSGEWVADGEHEPDDHKLGVVPVVPILNRPRLSRSTSGRGGPGGVSELTNAIPIVNAVNKIGTDMMISAEFHAMPRRWALGFGPEDFQDEQGRTVSTWSKIAGRIWASAKNSRDDGASVGQFPEAQLSNFHETVKLLATLFASVYGLPATYMGISYDNPPSADGVRSLEARLIKRTERKTRSWGGAWERTMRIGDRIVTGRIRPELARLEAQWANPATPTRAQAADAAVKLRAERITSLRQTWRDLGYTAEQQDQMQADLDDEDQAAAAVFKLAPADGGPAPDPAADVPAA